MSDEPTRSAPGNQRRPTDVPSWWSELARPDLPDDETGSAPGLSLLAEPERSRAAAGLAERLRNVLAVLVIAVLALLVGWVAIGAGSLRNLVVALLIFGMPAALAASAAAVARRWH